MISIYNSDKKELIAIFDSPSNAGRYLFGKTVDSAQRSSKVLSALRRKTGIIKSLLDCRVVVRNSNEEHKKLLGQNIFWINEGYYKPDNFLFCGYHSTRIDLAAAALKKTK